VSLCGSTLIRVGWYIVLYPAFDTGLFIFNSLGIEPDNSQIGLLVTAFIKDFSPEGKI